MWDDEQEEGQAEELFSPDQYEFDEESHENDDDCSSFSSTGRVLRSPVSSSAISWTPSQREEIDREREERDQDALAILRRERQERDLLFEGGMRRLSVDSATDYLTRERYESSSQSSDQ